MSFDELRRANIERCESAYHPVEDWSPTDWACAAAGEMGEACNVIKKLRRGAEGAAKTVLLSAAADEIADTVIYLDLLAARLGIDLGRAVVEKFNRTSDKVRSRVVLTNPPAPGGAGERGEG